MSFSEKAFLFPLKLPWHIYQKSVDIIRRECFWIFYSVPLVFMSIYMEIAYCLDYCSFILTSKIKEYTSFNFDFLF